MEPALNFLEERQAIKAAAATTNTPTTITITGSLTFILTSNHESPAGLDIVRACVDPVSWWNLVLFERRAWVGDCALVILFILLGGFKQSLWISWLGCKLEALNCSRSTVDCRRWAFANTILWVHPSSTMRKVPWTILPTSLRKRHLSFCLALVLLLLFQYRAQSILFLRALVVKGVVLLQQQSAAQLQYQLLCFCAVNCFDCFIASLPVFYWIVLFL